MNNDCSDCFHYGKSPLTGVTGCVLLNKCDVCPGKCHYYVRWFQ